MKDYPKKEIIGTLIALIFFAIIQLIGYTIAQSDQYIVIRIIDNQLLLWGSLITGDLSLISFASIIEKLGIFPSYTIMPTILGGAISYAIAGFVLVGVYRQFRQKNKIRQWPVALKILTVLYLVPLASFILWLIFFAFSFGP